MKFFEFSASTGEFAVERYGKMRKYVGFVPISTCARRLARQSGSRKWLATMAFFWVS
jgi:hypothetical protein